MKVRIRSVSFTNDCCTVDRGKASVHISDDGCALDTSDDGCAVQAEDTAGTAGCRSFLEAHVKQWNGVNADGSMNDPLAVRTQQP